MQAAEAESSGNQPSSFLQITILIAGIEEVFPVRRIYCVGRNYAAHAIERGSDPNREPPFFQKPTDAIQVVAVGQVADHPYPTLTKNYHHEVELVAALKSGGEHPAGQAARALPTALCGRPRYDAPRPAERHGGREEAPWEIGKSFDHSAVIGPIYLFRRPDR